MKKLIEFLKKVKTDERLGSLEEAAIKQSVVLKILSLLEWDPFSIDEVEPDYHVEDGKIDFALKHNNSNRVFINAKIITNNYQMLQDELLNRAVSQNVQIAILTNGLSWWFYLPLMDGSPEKKLFHTIEIQHKDEKDIAQAFLNYLSKQNIISGKTLKTAEAIYNNKKKLSMINEFLPKAWQKILSEPEKWLADIITQATKDLCGYKPDKETVLNFILAHIKGDAQLLQSQPPPLADANKKMVKKDLKGKAIKSFTFKGKKYDVHSWKAMALTICDIMFENHKEDFESILYISLDGKNCFSRNPHEFLECEKISDVDIYMDLHLTTKNMLALCKEMLLLFGYKENELVIESEPISM